MTDDALKALATIIAHRDAVRLNVQALTHELERRALRHDLTKLSLDEVEGFVRINAAARTHAYGSEEYRASMDAEKGPSGCIGLHYARNSHHPEHHALDSRMGFLDIIEMVLDWKAASDTYGKMTLRGSLPHHRERFDFTVAQWWLIEQVVDWIEPTGHTEERCPHNPPDEHCEHEECGSDFCRLNHIDVNASLGHAGETVSGTRKGYGGAPVADLTSRSVGHTGEGT